MSDLDVAPEEHRVRCLDHDGPETLLLTARRVPLGRTTEVARVLPDRSLRMVGAWCFLDHYGPEDVSDAPGMRVWAHPHTGLQTVSWLLAGEIEHRDSVGSHAVVRPGELHVMTAGHGIVHSELSPQEKPPLLHGLQLWVVLPAHRRDVAPRFDSYRELPRLDRPGLRGQVLVGTVDGVASPAVGHTPLCGADLELDAGAEARLSLDPSFEHAVFVVSGRARVGGVEVGGDQLLYLGTGRDGLALHAEQGARLLLLGGEPFTEEVVMWWNFVGRSHDEVAAFRTAWEERADRFPPVVERGERVMEAPPLPSVPLRPRPRRRGVA